MLLYITVSLGYSATPSLGLGSLPQYARQLEKRFQSGQNLHELLQNLRHVSLAKIDATRKSITIGSEPS